MNIIKKNNKYFINNKTEYLTAVDELKKWGAWHAYRSIDFSFTKCSLNVLIDYGQHIASGYAEITHEYEDMPPDIEQTNNFWQAMGHPYKLVLWQTFAVHSNNTQKMKFLGLKQKKDLHQIRKMSIRSFIKLKKNVEILDENI